MQTNKAVLSFVIVAGAIVTAGVLLLLKYGYTPAPQRIMKPSHFASVEDLGRTVMKRFYGDLALENTIVLGVQVQEPQSLDFLRGYLSAAKDEGKAFTHALVEVELPADYARTLTEFGLETQSLRTNTVEQTDFASAVKAVRTASGFQRLLIVLPNLYASHVIQNSPMHRLEKVLGESKSMFTILLSTLATAPDQERQMEFACVGSERDTQGTAALGCSLMMSSRSIYRAYRKLLEKEPVVKDRVVAIIQKTAGQDHHVLYRLPLAASANSGQ
ncbi:MAG TPA: hypothetical protein PLZ57_09095 [Pseudobdellovibrionaceae bacterium]|nr:hypothetical protein [Pseudobdellovibrionaceae bacterium]